MHRIQKGTYAPHMSTRYQNRESSSDRGEKGHTNPLPELYEKRENCCGCSACYSICPVNAITMLPDEEGFLYPVVDASKCIRCGKCLSVCAFKDDQKAKGY